VSNVLQVLESAGAKMLRLEDVVSDQLEAEGRVLAEKVAEHMLTCFRSQDPVVSLEPVVLGPAVETEEATSSSGQEATKSVAAWFQRLLEDA
jgi:hypothetical protein